MVLVAGASEPDAVVMTEVGTELEDAAAADDGDETAEVATEAAAELEGAAC